MIFKQFFYRFFLIKKSVWEASWEYKYSKSDKRIQQDTTKAIGRSVLLQSFFSVGFDSMPSPPNPHFLSLLSSLLFSASRRRSSPASPSTAASPPSPPPHLPRPASLPRLAAPPGRLLLRPPHRGHHPRASTADLRWVLPSSSHPPTHPCVAKQLYSRLPTSSPPPRDLYCTRSVFLVWNWIFSLFLELGAASFFLCPPFVETNQLSAFRFVNAPPLDPVDMT